MTAINPNVAYQDFRRTVSAELQPDGSGTLTVHYMQGEEGETFARTYIFSLLLQEESGEEKNIEELQNAGTITKGRVEQIAETITSFVLEKISDNWMIEADINLEGLEIEDITNELIKPDKKIHVNSNIQYENNGRTQILEVGEDFALKDLLNDATKITPVAAIQPQTPVQSLAVPTSINPTNQATTNHTSIAPNQMNDLPQPSIPPSPDKQTEKRDDEPIRLSQAMQARLDEIIVRMGRNNESLQQFPLSPDKQAEKKDDEPIRLSQAMQARLDEIIMRKRRDNESLPPLHSSSYGTNQIRSNVSQKKTIEVFYVGTHESSPY
jgi:hypothetical protein